jgi:hypothetical protein
LGSSPAWRAIMSRRFINALLVCLAFAASAASAVALNPRGIGQVLIYPYYTVNRGQDTLFTLVNSSDTAKVARVRFLEGYDGRTVFATYVFLSAHDVWTAAITEVADDGGAKIATADASCTYPAMPTPTAIFTDDDFTGSNADTGPTSLTRTREGSIEVIEAADIAHGSAAEMAVTHIQNGTPGGGVPACSFATGSNVQPVNLNDLAPPTGGLYGSGSIVNVPQGTLFAYSATALAGFTDVLPVDDLTDSAQPALDQAHSTASSRTARAYVDVAGRPLAVDYDRGIDAVSAVLMSDTIENEFLTTVALGAATDWVVTFPTKRYYVDSRISGTPFAPFDETFGDHDSGDEQVTGQSRIVYDGSIFDREEMGSPTFSCGFICPGGVFPPALPFQVNVVNFVSDSIPGTPSAVLGSVLTTPYLSPILFPPPNFPSGWMRMNFNPHALPGGIIEPNDAVALGGLPTVGFMVYSVINANARPGVLGNYGGTFPHRSTLACGDINGQPCPSIID